MILKFQVKYERVQDEILGFSANFRYIFTYNLRISKHMCKLWCQRSETNFLILNYLITLCCISVPFQKLSSFVLVIFLHLYR